MVDGIRQYGCGIKCSLISYPSLIRVEHGRFVCCMVYDPPDLPVNNDTFSDCSTADHSKYFYWHLDNTLF